MADKAIPAPKRDRRLGRERQHLDQTLRGHQAERVAHWIRVDAVSDWLVRSLDQGSAEGQHRLLSQVEVVHQNVDVYLLGRSRRVPARSHEVSDPLQGEQGRLVELAQRHPLRAFPDLAQARELLVEARESKRVRAVDDNSFKVPITLTPSHDRRDAVGTAGDGTVNR